MWRLNKKIPEKRFCTWLKRGPRGSNYQKTTKSSGGPPFLIPRGTQKKSAQNGGPPEKQRPEGGGVPAGSGISTIGELGLGGIKKELKTQEGEVNRPRVNISARSAQKGGTNQGNKTQKTEKKNIQDD